jgi:hypothetical protein
MLFHSAPTAPSIPFLLWSPEESYVEFRKREPIIYVAFGIKGVQNPRERIYEV